MVNKSVVLRKISFIRHNLSRLKDKENISLESLKNDFDIQDIVLHNLQLAIQGCIDIGSHVISDEGWGVAGSLNEIFYILQNKGVIKAEMSEKMISMVGFRNILVHEYETINFAIVCNILQHHLKDINEYLLTMVNHFNLG
ncbi:MAG: DUF86 domain-containing protein [Candidatus Scalindua rubra]|uniref:DUF86 domain-containing protein n=1 Tax=Candidatus Scalindua brodae TaxID=237368 RepID=A0A0B0EH36_9BACT|nr:MAG: hypothetical protein SCABRO_03806 [Candidatus Scalindua brodae]MBZ0109621.1 DUF86 domain-containing protein [Candidatus Scalindua rubra]TWU33125.1 hypothetical protein S225a_15750 [Candidatus Brocadiaceae bacterium S225]